MEGAGTAYSGGIPFTNALFLYMQSKLDLRACIDRPWYREINQIIATLTRLWLE